ncbi:MAG TPA: acyltransferase [Acidimicrobiia bacterium]|nr:acyltransferase [Acidimicrobiia bacterium]
MPEPEVGGLESAAPSRGTATTRFPCFDGFRAIAALSVLVTHVGFTSGLNGRSPFGAYTARMDIGIAVFFLISGFLLYRPFVAARFAGRAGPRVGPYFWRRALRILPAYWVALTVVIFVLDHGPRDVKSLALWYGLAHIYSYEHVIGPIVQSWTLATEISFYLFLPAYAWFMSRVVGGHSERRLLRTELAGVAVMYVTAFAFRSVLLAGDASPRVNGTLTKWLFANLDLFALGMLLAVVSVWVARGDDRRRAPLGVDHPWAPGVCWGLAALAFWVVSTRLGLPRQTIDYEPLGELSQQFLYGVIALLVLVPGVFGPQDRGLVRGFLRHPVVQMLGLISYGLYLWQNVWVEEYVDWADARLFATPFGEMLIVVLVLSIAAATVSYLVIERPVLRLKRAVT